MSKTIPMYHVRALAVADALEPLATTQRAREALPGVAYNMLRALFPVTATDVSMSEFTNTALGEPYGYTVGHLAKSAVACLEDVVSHSGDIIQALEARLAIAVFEDKNQCKNAEDGMLGTPNQAYWLHQIEVYQRMVKQARDALEIHKYLSKGKPHENQVKAADCGNDLGV